MKILHAVEFYQPSVGGAQEVVRQVSTRLAMRGHEVTVATSSDERRTSNEIDGVRIQPFAISGNAARGLRGQVEEYQRFVCQGDFDIVMTYAAQQWTTDALLPVLGDIPAARILAPCGFSGLHRPRYRRYFAELPSRLAEFDALVFHSDTYQDAQFARDAGLTNSVVIPNGADDEEFALRDPDIDVRAELAINRYGPLIVAIGSHTGRKGHGLLMHAFAQSEAGQTGTLLLIGNNPWHLGCAQTCAVLARLHNAGKGERIVLTSVPRPFVVAALKSADLFLHCSPTECSPLVLFEAAAAGLPFISLDAGNAGEIARWLGGGIIVPKPRRRISGYRGLVRDVAQAIDTALQDPQALAERGQEMRRAWKRYYSWSVITMQYETLYERLSDS
jgi:glycosyltransferase involved in cell wall biosynthesis